MIETFPAPSPETIQFDPVIDDLDSWRQSQGFIKGRRGTYRNADGSHYYYEKPCHSFEALDQAQESLRVIRHLTEREVFHPDTNWFMGKGWRGGYQIVGISPALQAENAGVVPLEEIFSDGSKFMELARRIDPAFTIDKPPADDSLSWLLNFSELSHLDNWGTDPATGREYAIDVEAVGLTHERQQAVVRKWNADNPIS